MQADFALEYDVLTLEQSHRLFLMARLVSGPAQEQSNRRPLNLSLVIDRSGSMGGDKIGYTRQAASWCRTSVVEIPCRSSSTTKT